MMKKVPFYFWVLIGIVIVCTVLGTVFSFVDELYWLFFVFSFIDIIFSFIVFVLDERWEVKHSGKELVDFKGYCEELYQWLCCLSINSKNDIELLLKRLTDYVDNQKEKRELQNNKIDKWMQTLIIPLILAIITSLISNQADVEAVLTYIFFMLAVVAMVYGLLWLVRSIVGILKTQKRNKIEYFIEDLKGVLDVVFIFNNSLNQPETVIENKNVIFE